MEMMFGLGWKPSLPDHRDLMLGVTPGMELPEKVDLRPGITFSAYHQGDMNSCTAHAGAAIMPGPSCFSANGIAGCHGTQRSVP